MRIVLPLLALTALAALFGPIIEGRERSAERAVRGYLDAIQHGAVSRALENLDPVARSDWRIFVEHQAGDMFRVRELSVQRTPFIAGLSGWGKPLSVTVVAEIAGKGGEHWQATSHVIGRSEGGRWFIQNPPFGPDEPWLVPPES
jgi:hypothetical protein